MKYSEEGCMRLHLAEPERKVNPPDIQMALEYWQNINSAPNLWARFESLQFDRYRRVSVVWGDVLSDAKQHAIQTIHFLLLNDGSVHVSRHNHL